MSYLKLLALRTAPRCARCHAGVVLKAWRIPSEVIETTELLVSELITNAVRAAEVKPTTQANSELMNAKRVSLLLRLSTDRIVIEVFDTDPNPPTLAEASTDANSGRGLTIVQALSKEWGYFFPPAGGKVVYCMIRTQ